MLLNTIQLDNNQTYNNASYDYDHILDVNLALQSQQT